jgi:hypothetical protein
MRILARADGPHQPAACIIMAETQDRNGPPRPVIPTRSSRRPTGAEGRAYEGTRGMSGQTPRLIRAKDPDGGSQ